MRYLLLALIIFLIASQVFGFDPGPMPGVKVKNALLYLILLGLMLRLTMDRSYRIQLPAVTMLQGILIAYSILTYALIVLVIRYPRYDWLQSGMILKNSLFDQMMFFLVFFYGLRTNEDAMSVLKVLLAAWALSHVMAVLDATGIFHIGNIEQREDGRVQGMSGESNMYGAFVALTLPGMVALVTTSTGIFRLFWIGASIITAATLAMTVSRGAFVATAFAAMAGWWLFRRYLSMRKLMQFAAFGAVAAVLAGVVVVSLGFGGLIIQRVVWHGSTGDIGTTSSGRTEIWARLFEVMFEKPVTLLTGYGWQAYQTFPMRWATHNHYFEQYFNLGVIGLACSVLLFVILVRTAKRAALLANADVRPQLIGFGIGTIAIATAVCFVNLYSPWLYYWSYAGIAMRLAANALEPVVPRVAAVPAAPARRANRMRDPHGWTAAS
jgi:O-antigen ligase